MKRVLFNSSRSMLLQKIKPRRFSEYILAYETLKLGDTKLA